MTEPIHQRTVVITNPHGLHARPAELFARLALSFESEIEVVRDNHRVDAKSILNVLTLGAAQGVELVIEARGRDAAEAIEALANLVESDFSQDNLVSRERSS
ncbi:MAG: HPr family phosphocarrier protein [Planctomycetales bacterium]|nr:HPr family phosphocarrier protein [Planctomycetales bacterium]